MHAPFRGLFGSGFFVALALPLACSGGVYGATVDRPVKIVQTTEIQVNYRGDPNIPTQGEVRMALVVDETGKLEDLLLLGSTHRVFTDAAVEGLQQWRFEPAVTAGQPVRARTVVKIRFDAKGRVLSLVGFEILAGRTDSMFQSNYTSRLAEPDELDQPLRTVQTRQAGFPVQLLGRLSGRSTVTVDFYVDEQGRTRMPVVVESDHPLLSAAAINAIERWEFEPPTRSGRPVVVRARQDFVFFESGAEAS